MQMSFHSSLPPPLFCSLEVFEKLVGRQTKAVSIGTETESEVWTAAVLACLFSLTACHHCGDNKLIYIKSC